MMSFIMLDGATSLLCLKDVTNTCKRMQLSLRIGGSSSVQWGNLEEADEFKCVFVVYCVFESK